MQEDKLRQNELRENNLQENKLRQNKLLENNLQENKFKKNNVQKNKLIYKRLLKNTLIISFWILVWQILYMIVQQDILIASPYNVAKKLGELIFEKSFWIGTISSLLRIVLGFLLAVIFGTVIAIISSRFKLVGDFLKPIITIINATPVASFIILALVWLTSWQVPVLTSVLIVLPSVYDNLLQGIKGTDKKLLEVAEIYEFGIWKTLKNIYIPSVMPYFIAACTTGIGLAWKAGVAAEVISNTKNSIGGKIYESKIYIETVDLFAWTIVVIVLSFMIKKLMMRLMKKLNKKYAR